jgi:hypothetical protein
MRYLVRLAEDSQIHGWFDSPDAAINQCKEYNEAISKDAGYEVKDFEVYDHEEDKVIF